MRACFEIDVFRSHEDSLFTPPPRDGNVYLTKLPGDIVIAGLPLRLDPDLHVICMIRDPRDMIVSKHKRDPDRYWAGLRFWKTRTPYWRRLRHHPRFITVKYEELVTNPDGVQTRLAAGMPFLETRAPFSRYHELSEPPSGSVRALGGVRPIEPAGIGKWRSHLPRVAGQLQLHGSISQDLVEFGYEQDDQWLQALEGVEPDLQHSHWPEFDDRNRRARKGPRNRSRSRVLKEAVKILLRRAGLWKGIR
jgi:hypothetical protein